MKLVVNTCWKYRDAWQPFMGLLKVHWPDCPYPLGIMTDKADTKWLGPGIIDLRQQVYQTGYDRGWCYNLLEGLASEPPSEIILLMQEDFFLTAKVDTAQIEQYCHYMWAHSEVHCIRLYPCPGAFENYDEWPKIGTHPPGVPYRVSCQAALWRISTLRMILGACRTPVEFEMEGSRHADRWFNKGFYSVWREKEPWPLEYLCSGISRGRWNPDALKLFEKHNLNVDLSLRPVEGV